MYKRRHYRSQQILAQNSWGTFCKRGYAATPTERTMSGVTVVQWSQINEHGQASAGQPGPAQLRASARPLPQASLRGAPGQASDHTEASPRPARFSQPASTIKAASQPASSVSQPANRPSPARDSPTQYERTADHQAANALSLEMFCRSGLRCLFTPSFF